MTTTCTPVVVGTGAPAVDVTVVWNVGGITNVTIERSVATGVWVPLRFGSPALLVAGSVTVRDYEVPDNVAATYRAYPVGASGSAVTGGPVTVPERGTWFIHPGSPDTLSTGPMIAASDGWPKWQRSARQDAAAILGVSAPIVVSDVRGARTGTLSVILQSTAEAAALDALLSDTRVILLNSNRYPAPYVWCAVGDETWAPLRPRIGAASTALYQVDLPLTEVDRPAVTTSGEVTWLDVAARYATFDLLAARYSTFDAFWVDAATWTS